MSGQRMEASAGHSPVVEVSEDALLAIAAMPDHEALKECGDYWATLQQMYFRARELAIAAASSAPQRTTPEKGSGVAAVRAEDTE